MKEGFNVGFHELLHYGQEAYRNKWRIRRKVCRFFLRIRYQCDIDLAADIAPDVYFCHPGFGIVINPRVKIGGDACSTL